MRYTAVLLLLASLGSAVSASAARAQISVAEQYLFQAANLERQSRGLPPLHWDNGLYRAAQAHAQEMAARQSISHQYPGEPELGARAQRAGAHFSVVAENVAEAPTSVRIHDAWMRSAGHRENLLDGRVDSVGISVLSRNGQLYAVEDFDRSVQQLSFDDQESAVGQMLNAVAPLQVSLSTEEARRTCAMDTGFAGDRRPWFVMRFTTAELDRLPDELKARLATGKYRAAAVGACSMHSDQPFTAYNIAVLLYP